MVTEDYRNRLIAAAGDLIEAFQKRLTWDHGFYRGALSRSFGNVTVKEDRIIFELEDYVKYIEKGTPNPTTPQEIMDWVQKKIMPKVKVKGKDRVKQKERIAKAIAKHISVYGPRPYPFIQMTLEQDWPKIKEKNGL